MRTSVVVVVLAIGMFHPAVDQAASAASPSRDAEVIASGSAKTRIGRVSWTAVKGDATNLPFGQIFATPDGYAVFEPPGEHESRFWWSPDGLDWSVAPMPVPTNGWAWHSVAGGEHWILAPQEFRLWRSSDFASWTEVDMRSVEPPRAPGIRWTSLPTNLAVVGSTAVLSWHDIRAILALDDLLGIDLGPDEGLSVGTVWDEPAIGEERPIWLRQGISDGISSEDPKERVGSIRVVLDGPIVRIIDVTRDAVVATIDADTVGVPSNVIAEGLNGLGQFDVPAKGIVIENDVARPFDGPSGIRYLEPIGKRLMALAGELGAGLVVWVSSDGVDWEHLGPPIPPSTSVAWSQRLELVERPARNPSQPLEALVDVDGPRARDRQELWTSDDGLVWVRTSVLATRPAPSIRGIGALSGGYLGIGDGSRVRVSVDGRRWTHVKHLRGIGRSIDRHGGGTSTSVVPDSVFYTEDPDGPRRLLWKLSVRPDR